MFAIRLFGTLGLEKDGQPIGLPPSRKTRALLGYLVIARQPKRRDDLCGLLWDLPDDPRGALRWSLSKLRPLLADGDTTCLVADRASVAISCDTITTDLDELRDAADHAGGPRASPEAIWQATSQPLMADCELSNQDSYMLWLENIRNQAAALRARLAARMTEEAVREGDPAAATVWATRWLSEAPFDPQAALALVQARRSAGRIAEAEMLIARFEQEFRDAGIELPHLRDPLPPPAAPPPPAPPPSPETLPPSPRQTIRFVRASDGTSLAWASVGDAQAPPLVKAANWLSHLDLDWEAPIWSPLFHDLSSSFNFVRYDERGCGLSDWNVPSIDFESFVTDLELVVDAAGLDRFPLLGISQGAAVSIEYAVRHPERVSHLILVGGYPVGWRATADESEAREREAVMVLTESGWGRDNPVYRNIFSQTFMPGATREELAWFDEFQRNTTSAQNAARFLEAFSRIDVRHRLAEVQAPTLVAHSLHEQRIPAEVGHALAAGIPGAEFVGLASPNHLLLGREPAAQTLLDAMRDFIGR